MEGNLNLKNIKPTLSTPTSIGKKHDNNFKKAIKTTGMSIKEESEDKKENFQKKIFKLDKMETLVFSDEKLSKLYSEMEETWKPKLGYHWYEAIMSILFNDNVINSPKYLQKYKNTRAKSKTRRGEEGIAQLQNDLAKEKEATSGAEEIKNDLINKNSKSEIDELFGFGGKNMNSELPLNQRSKNDTYFVDKSNRLLATVPFKSTPEEKQSIMSKYVGNPNYKQISWFDAVTKGIKGVPREVSDGTYEQMKAEMDSKYQKQGGVQAIPALGETTAAVSSGAFSKALDDQDKTYQNETTTSASSGQYSGKAIWSKNEKPAANKPAWKGGVVLGESVINGDLNYLTDPTPFKKYILNYKISELLNESTSPEQSKKIYDMLVQYHTENPETKNDPNFMKMIQDYSQTPQSNPIQSSPIQKATVDSTKQWSPEFNEATDQDKYEDVVFMQGEEADEPLQILNDQGPDAAMEYLKQWHDVGNHMGRNELPHGSSDQTYDKDGYHMSWNDRIGYIGLTYDLNHGVNERLSSEVKYNAYTKAKDDMHQSENDPLRYNRKRNQVEKFGSHIDPKYIAELNKIAQSIGLTSKIEKFNGDNYGKIEPYAYITFTDLKNSKNNFEISIEPKKYNFTKNYPPKEITRKLENFIKIFQENELDINRKKIKEEPSFDGAMEKDLKYTGKKVTDNESTDELESQDGLFKGKWNENITETVQDLTPVGLSNWVEKNVSTERGLDQKVLLDFIDNNNISLDSLETKAKLFKSNSSMFGNDRKKIKNMMEELLHTIATIQYYDDQDRQEMEDMQHEGYGGDPEVGEDQYNDEKSSNEYITLENQMKELLALKKAGKINELKAKIESLPMIPIANHSGNQNEFGHGDLVDLGYMKRDYSFYGGGEDDFELQIKNISNKPIATLDKNKHSYSIHEPGSVYESNKKEKPLINEKKIMNKKEYKNIVKAMIESTGKTLKTLNENEKKSIFKNADFLYESIIDDQPDSMINNQETSMVKSMDTDELNVDGQPIAGVATGGVQEGDADFSDAELDAKIQKPVYNTSFNAKLRPKTDVSTGDYGNPELDKQAREFKEKLKSMFGVDSVDQLSNSERQQLMNNMNISQGKSSGMDFNQFKASDAEKEQFFGRDKKMLSFLAQNSDKINDLNDFGLLGREFKKETGENLHHPMAILASIQALPSDSELRSKLSNLENILQSKMKSVNEERKPSSILNVEKLGKENAKNFNSDLAKEDGVNQDETYPKDDGIHKAPVFPNPKDFYIEQDLDKVQKDAKSMADLEKEAIAKGGWALKNVGNSANEKGNEITKRNLSKEEMVAVAMNRGDGMQDIVYDNKPSEKFEKRMEKDLGKDIYKLRQDKMDFKADAPMYNKDSQPTATGDKKEENNKFKKGYNSESVTGKYKDEFNKFKIVEFKLSDVEIVETINENAYKLSLDGMGNKYSLVGKKINENTGYEDIADSYNFYLHENKIYAIIKSVESTEPKVYNKGKVNESSFEKMKHLMNYKPTNYVDGKKSVKF